MESFQGFLCKIGKLTWSRGLPGKCWGLKGERREGSLEGQSSSTLTAPHNNKSVQLSGLTGLTLAREAGKAVMPLS